jgi:hypothetical protein
VEVFAEGVDDLRKIALDELHVCFSCSYGKGFVDFETQPTNGRFEVTAKFVSRLAPGRRVWKAALAEAKRVFTNHGLTFVDIDFFGEFM